MDIPPAKPANLLRRLAAIFYDSLLLIALTFIVTALWLPITGGEAITAANPLRWLYQAGLLIVGFTFFGGFWLRGGRTLGMRTWRIRVQQPNGRPITLRQAVLRFTAAILSLTVMGLGFLWSLVDARSRTWHDIWSGTVLVYLPKGSTSCR